MERKYSLVQIGRNVENGRYCGQIQLGDGFLKQVSEMSSSISWLGFQNEKTAYKIDLLNYKINRILANKIEFECKGIDFSKSTDFSDLEIVVIRNLASTISQNLCAFIDDFENHREFGDPMVWNHSIVFLFAVYSKIKGIQEKQDILSESQIEMIEGQFIECFRLFNSSIRQAMVSNNWNFTINLTSAFFGGNYFFPPQSHFSNVYLSECLFAFKELGNESFVNNSLTNF